MIMLPPELANLPVPTLIEEISYDARLVLFRHHAKAAFAAVGIAYDVDGQEFDPAQILLQTASYQDALLRQRINEAVRGYLLPYASGADLDILANFYDVARQLGELDDRLRARVVLAIRGRSTGGTEPRYRSVAMSSDLRVADVSIYTIGRDPTIHAAVFSTDNAGIADAALLAKVTAALNAPAVRMVNDRIEVSAAVRQLLDVSCRVWLLPQTSATITMAMEAALRLAWASQIVLGRDVTRSWLVSQLMLDGVQRVEIGAPSADIIVPPYQAVALGLVTIEISGRDY